MIVAGAACHAVLSTTFPGAPRHMWLTLKRVMTVYSVAAIIPREALKESKTAQPSRSLSLSFYTA